MIPDVFSNFDESMKSKMSQTKACNFDTRIKVPIFSKSHLCAPHILSYYPFDITIIFLQNRKHKPSQVVTKSQSQFHLNQQNHIWKFCDMRTCGNGRMETRIHN